MPSYFEGLPNAACEAISCGLPLIISDVCDNKILVDKLNGYLFDPYNPKDIAKKIISFCKKIMKKRILCQKIEGLDLKTYLMKIIISIII